MAGTATSWSGPSAQSDESALPVVVAPDSFTGSLTAAEATAAIVAGLQDAAETTGTALDFRRMPIADGGEGTVEVLVAAGWQRTEHTVTGPTGQPTRAAFALSMSTPRTAVVELAQASGLLRLPGGQPAAMQAGTFGTGQLVAAALDARVDRIVLGLGGSASTDGGTGMAAAVGARLLDDVGQNLPPGGAALRDLARIDVSGLDPRLASTEVVVACDVDNPLTGPSGAARIFAPQKGATPAEVDMLDAALVRLAEVVRRDLGLDIDVPGAGAAGGSAAGSIAFLGGRLTTGVDVVLDLLEFDAALAGAGLLITGEGSFDAQSLSGKAPIGAARRAKAAGVPVIVLAGRAVIEPSDRRRLDELGVIDVRALLDLEPDQSRARADAAPLLRDLAARVWTDHHSVVGSAR